MLPIIGAIVHKLNHFILLTFGKVYIHSLSVFILLKQTLKYKKINPNLSVFYIHFYTNIVIPKSHF